MTSTIPRTQRQWVYRYLIERDGNKCSLCGKKEKDVKLEIDHINGNPSNQDPKNLRLLCHSCNIKNAIHLNQKSRHKHHGVFVEREGEKLDATTKYKQKIKYYEGSIEMQANECYELEFRSWLTAYLKNFIEIEKEEAIASGAERTGASINACRNYLMKFTSKEGPGYIFRLQSKTRVVRLKKQYLHEKGIESEEEENIDK